MIDRDEAERLLEQHGHVFLASGEDAGPVLRVYLDEYTGWPSFCTVASAGSGEDETLVALHEAEHRGPPHDDPSGVDVPYDRARLDAAPTVEPGRDLSIAEEDALFAYYGVPIDGVTPVVEHLGSVLVLDEEHAGREVVEQDVDHPPG